MAFATSLSRFDEHFLGICSLFEWKEMTQYSATSPAFDPIVQTSLVSFVVIDSVHAHLLSKTRYNSKTCTDYEVSRSSDGKNFKDALGSSG